MAYLVVEDREDIWYKLIFGNLEITKIKSGILHSEN